MTTAPRRRRNAAQSRPKLLALAYVRVSTSDQAEYGASLDAQRAILTAEAQHRGWDVEIVADEGLSGKEMTKRPALLDALARLDRGEADALLSTRMDRVSRSVPDFVGLLDRATRKGWGLVLLDPNIDLATPSGRMTSVILAAVAENASALTGQRTSEAMQQRKREGWPNGKPTGRPAVLPEIVVDRIVVDRAAGRSWSAIARQLNDEQVPTAHGGARWHPATVQKIALRAIAAA